MSETLQLPVGATTDLFLELIEDAIETIENDAYQLHQVHAAYRDAEVAMEIYESLQHLADERSPEADVFIRPAFKRLEAAYEAAARRFEEELHRDKE